MARLMLLLPHVLYRVEAHDDPAQASYWPMAKTTLSIKWLFGET
jgi:hypothetical protein